MKTGKRMILLLAAVLMIVSLAACKTDDAIRQTDDPVTDPPKVTGDAQTTVPDATSASKPEQSDPVQPAAPVEIVTAVHEPRHADYPASPAAANRPYVCLSDWGIGIELPEAWAGRFHLIISEDRVGFCHAAVFGRESSLDGRIFTLKRCDLKSAGALADLAPGTVFPTDGAPWEQMVIGKNDRYLFAADFPSDVQIDLESADAKIVAAEYAAMQEDIFTQNYNLRLWEPMEP